MDKRPVDLPPHLRRLRLRARLALIWETYALTIMPALGVLAVFLMGAFLGVWERIGDPWRLMAAVATLAILGRALWQARTYDWPGQSDAERRIEADNNLAHRPLETLKDTPSKTGDANIWPAHQRRAREQSEGIKGVHPLRVIGPKDRFFLHLIIPAFLLISLMSGGLDSLERLRHAMTPGWLQAVSPSAATFEAWIDPPEYTARPPVYFKTRNSVTAPEGSEFVARISGLATPPRLTIIEDGRRRHIKATPLGPKTFEARTILNADTEAYWRVGNLKETWDIDVKSDIPPFIEFEDIPEADKRDQMVFSYNLDDDYGVTGLALVVVPVENPDNFAPDSISLSLPGRSVKALNDEPTRIDVTRHRWAGQLVEGWLEAADGKGQISQSRPEMFALPEKIFIKPLAKAALEQRALYLNAVGDYAPLETKAPITLADLEVQPVFEPLESERRFKRAPENIQRIKDLIEAITDVPEGYYPDPMVYMGFRSIAARIRYGHDMDSLGPLDEELWLLAERAEFGRIADAKAAMQAAERDLQDAMARRAPQREIDVLFERYNQAVERYMDALRREALEEGRISDAQGGGGGQNMNTDTIAELLKAIEEANAIGDTAGARRALAQLAELLENMRMQLSRGGEGGGEGDSEMSEEMREALEELADVMGEQRELEDDTRQNQNRQQNGGQPDENGESRSAGEEGQALAERQREIAENLGGLAESLDEQNALNGAGSEETEDGQSGGGDNAEETDPGGGGDTPREALRRAEGAMGRSEDALADGDLQAAIEAQRDAMDALRDFGQQVASNANRGNAENASNNGDPFGRPDGARSGAAIGTDENVDLENQRRLERAQDLLKELRDRAAEQGRDPEELEYLERLLERF